VFFVAWSVALPASRPYWKGYIKLALVSCPIGLYTASSSSERVAFRQINKKTGNRLRQQLVDDQTREVVEGPEKGRGFEYAKNSYLTIEDEEVEAIEIESNRTIEIDTFVPRSEIDERYCDSPYYIAPSEPVGQEAFAVIREAMRGKNMVALGRVVLAKRERVIMLQPWDNGLLGMTLRYPYEVRGAKDYFYDIPELKVDPELLDLAEHILRTKEAHFDPTKFVDRYEQALLEMLAAKQKGMPATPVKAFAPPQNVVNLFDALRQSLAEETKARPIPASAPKVACKKGKPRVKGQGELLLPISGKKANESVKAEEKKPAQTSATRRKAG
jgi:DNA end-binding protein Ku